MYSRQGNVLCNLKTNKCEDFVYIGEAKRASKEIQEQNGGLGRGSVIVLHRKRTKRK